MVVTAAVAYAVLASARIRRRDQRKERKEKTGSSKHDLGTAITAADTALAATQIGKWGISFGLREIKGRREDSTGPFWSGFIVYSQKETASAQIRRHNQRKESG